jgi:hypothetical protein
MLGWNDHYLLGQGHVQRPWRYSESSEGQDGDRGDCCRTGSRGSGRCCAGSGRARGYRCQVIHGDQVSADGHGRQYRSDRRDG